MSTRHVILTILNMQPDSGYGLAYRNDQTMRPMWSATHSQIYSALRTLLDEGLVTSKGGTKGTKREATIYNLTKAGREELVRWQNAPIQYPPSKDPFRFRMAHMDELAPDVAEAIIDRHLRQHRKLAAQLRAQATEFRDGKNAAFEKRHADLSSAKMRRLRKARVAVYEELARLAEFEVESAERFRAVAVQLRTDQERETKVERQGPRVRFDRTPKVQRGKNLRKVTAPRRISP